jgi:menaquinone-dependent protoporphyrinogen oxidase
MSGVLIAFDGNYGQSAKIAEFIADLARRRGFQVRVARVADVSPRDVPSFDGLTVVAPVYFGRHPKSIRHFLRAHAGILDERPSAFVSVSGSAGSPDVDARVRAREVASDALTSVGASPLVVATAGGALAYPRYNPVLRWVMRRIARQSGNPTDTSRIHELTDWKRLEEDLRPMFDLMERARDLGKLSEDGARPAPARSQRTSSIHHAS